jgi:hypothetical protein
VDAVHDSDIECNRPYREGADARRSILAGIWTADHGQSWVQLVRGQPWGQPGRCPLGGVHCSPWRVAGTWCLPLTRCAQDRGDLHIAADFQATRRSDCDGAGGNRADRGRSTAEGACARRGFRNRGACYRCDPSNTGPRSEHAFHSGIGLCAHELGSVHPGRRNVRR